MTTARLIYDIVRLVCGAYVLIYFGYMVKKYGGFMPAVERLRQIIFH